MQNKVQILSTKKLQSWIPEQLAKMNIEIIEKEFISIRPILTVEKRVQIMPFLIPLKTLTVVFTSANAVDVLKKHLHQGDTFYVPNWNIFCLQGKTKDSLHSYFSRSEIIGTAENASALAKEIIDFGTKEIVFFCGQNRRNELPDMLKKAGVNVHEIVLYETVEIPLISDKDFDGILFFSPSAVRSFFVKNKLNTTTQIFAIGRTTADEVKRFSKNSIIIPQIPETENLIDEVIKYFAAIKTV
jgi:uroporphyrinogen-III synthase